MAWLTGWNQRKKITLSRASGAVTDYQMRILVGESSGATGEDVDCGGKCLASFDDLRFTNAAGDLLDYWIETVTGTTPNRLARVWVKFDSIGTSDTDFYMYYGSATAQSAADGAATFIAFEDFEWGENADNLSDSGGSVTWSVTSGTPKISTAQKASGTRSGLWQGSTPNQTASIPLTASDEVAVHFSFYRSSTESTGPNVFHGNSSKYGGILADFDDTNLYYYDSSGVRSSVSIASVTWHRIEFRNYSWSAGTYSLYFNDALVANVASMVSSSFYEDVLHFALKGGPGLVYYDNIFVRKYLATGPAFGAWGEEQEKLIEPPPLSLVTGLSVESVLMGNFVTGAVLGLVQQLSVSEIHKFPATAFTYYFVCTLTSIVNQQQITIPMSSFQGRFHSGRPSYLSVVTSTLAQSDDIATIASDPTKKPTLTVYMRKLYATGVSFDEPLMTVDMDNIEIHEGATNASIVLSGGRTVSYQPKSVTLYGASYKSTNKGKIRYRCEPDMYLRPGDTVTVGESTFVAGAISYAISSEMRTMEVAEA